MCGICGKIFFNREERVSEQNIKTMMNALHHRGPDGEGCFISRNVGLGHKRLAIIDINTGQQPISNEDGTIWIVYNGEIYNYMALRSDLIRQGHTFKTETDTEVVIHLYEQHGKDCISKLRGMFSFALWDEKEELLLLVRDRVGIKPLYYYLTDKALIFASEIKAIILDPSVKKEVDPQIIDRFLTFRYTPGPETLFSNILKVRPGYCLIVRDGKVIQEQYWDLKPEPNKTFKDINSAIYELLELLRNTMKGHLISDVPVGFLLSGGVDSSSLLSLAMQEADKNISTYTIGFEEDTFADERYYARLVSNKFGTTHHDMTISANEFLDFLPKYVWYMEEPVCEPPAVALYYVSKMASQFVKVLISGEGGDEAFAGYQNYRNMSILEIIKRFLGPSQKYASKLIKKLSTIKALNKLERYALLMQVPFENYYFSRTSSPYSFFNKSFRELYSLDFQIETDKQRSVNSIANYFESIIGKNTLEKMLYIDTKTWLPDDLLIKADRMTMANSLELRVPLLDHKVLEFAASLPSSYKLKGLTTKYILKKAFDTIVPKEILHRKKIGFPVPYERWIRSELNDFVHDILLDKKSIERGFFKKKAIDKLLEDNLNGAMYSAEIFSLIILELWHRTFIDN